MAVSPHVISIVGLLPVATEKNFMQRNHYFLAIFTLAIIGLLNYAVPAQTKPPNQPVVVSAVAPVYAAVIRAVNLQGDFYVDVEIDRDGKVVSSKAVEIKLKVMRKILEEAADRWQFAPDENAEKRRRIQLTFTFRYVPKAAGFDSTTVFYPPYKIEVRDNTVIVNTIDTTQ